MTPGEAELARHELALAEDALRAARVLVDADAPRDAASRLYYAAFHAARAALTVRGLHAKTHSGQVTLFETTFARAPVLGRLLDLRVKADYGRGPFTTSADDLAALVVDGSAFVERCGAIVAEALAAGPDAPDPPPDY